MTPRQGLENGWRRSISSASLTEHPEQCARLTHTTPGLQTWIQSQISRNVSLLLMGKATAIAFIRRVASSHQTIPVAKLIGTILMQKALGVWHTFYQDGTMNHVTD
jgi:hypothetical protein